VPWPSFYFALANSLSVVSLQFLKLPALACVQPEVSYFTIYNGVTLGFFTFVCFCGFMYWYGPRTEVLKADGARRRRFKTQVLSVFIWRVPRAPAPRPARLLPPTPGCLLALRAAHLTHVHRTLFCTHQPRHTGAFS
jgi:hypothetical protein